MTFMPGVRAAAAAASTGGSSVSVEMSFSAGQRQAAR